MPLTFSHPTSYIFGSNIHIHIYYSQTCQRYKFAKKRCQVCELKNCRKLVQKTNVILQKYLNFTNTINHNDQDFFISSSINFCDFVVHQRHFKRYQNYIQNHPHIQCSLILFRICISFLKIDLQFSFMQVTICLATKVTITSNRSSN